MQDMMRLDLQRFAGEGTAPGEGGGESAPGVMAADAGQQSDKTAQERGKPSWDEILQDPDYKAAFDSRVQGIVQKRLAKSAQLQQRYETLRPALAVLAEQYGLDPDEPDGEKLRAAILADGARRSDPRPLLAHYGRLRAQAEQFKAVRPDFDLDRELRENERFVRMTAPQPGLSVADAYFAAHREELLADRERQALSAVTQTIVAGQSRPRELSGGPAAASSSLSYRQYSPLERKEFKTRLRQSWARGEKPTIGF